MGFHAPVHSDRQTSAASYIEEAAHWFDTVRWPDSQEAGGGLNPKLCNIRGHRY